MLKPSLSTTAMALTLALLVSLKPLPTTNGEAYYPKEKTEVRIANHLVSKATLQVHCKDKNTDLGVQQVPFNSTYGFRFRAALFGSTLYFCGFQWKNEFHWFDIYVEKRDFNTCGFHCHWDVWENGPCIVKPKIFEYTRCYPWNKDLV